MELERKLEERCCEKIEIRDGMALKVKVLGLRGFPDRLILLPKGIVFFVEFKRRKTGRLSAQQKKFRIWLAKLGFSVYVIDNDEDFDHALAQEIGSG